MDLPNKLFACHASDSQGPSKKARSDGGNGDAWGSTGVSYAFDWSAPPWDDITSKNRVVLADRSPANHSKKGSVVCYADGHYRFVKATPGAATGSITEDLVGNPVTVIVANPDAIGTDDGSDKTLIDNIYDTNGDQAKDPFAPLGGSARRSWVK